MNRVGTKRVGVSFEGKRKRRNILNRGEERAPKEYGTFYNQLKGSIR